MQYLPQSLVLPHVDAALSHGGAGITLGALVHGPPQLLLPGRARIQQPPDELARTSRTLRSFC